MVLNMEHTMTIELSLLFLGPQGPFQPLLARLPKDRAIKTCFASQPQTLDKSVLQERWDILFLCPPPDRIPESALKSFLKIHPTTLIVLYASEFPADPERILAAGIDEILCTSSPEFSFQILRVLHRAEKSRNVSQELETHQLSSNKFRRIVENSAVGLFRCTTEGRITECNTAFARILGFQTASEYLQDLVQGECSSSLHPDEKARIGSLLKKHREIREFETLLLRKDGKFRWASISALQIEDHAGIPFIEGSVENIHRRKTSEQLIIRAKQEWEQTFDSIPDIITILNEDMTIRRLNVALSNRLGVHPRDLIGKRCAAVFGSTEEDSRQLCERIHELARSDGDAEEMHIPRLGGDFLVTVSPFTPLGLDTPNATEIVIVAHDISSRKQLEDQLRQSQKLKAIGTLAGGIAHDFNNILGVIMGYAEMSQEEIPEKNPARRWLSEVIAAGNRARDLIHQILTFSRQEEVSLKALHVDSVIKEVSKLMRASLPSNISIVTTIAHDTNPVMANLSQLHQVLVNLCTNAAQAMSTEGGTLTIVLAHDTFSTEDGSTSPAVRITVRDTGPGIAPEILDNIFDPFFSTKKSEGTGMGLAMAHGIIKAHSGQIRAESHPGYGAAFHISLPVVPDAQPAPLKPLVRREDAQGTGRVLIIDDEKELASIGGEMLNRLGYTPVVVTDSRLALERFRTEPDSFRFVITDQTMPGITGERLAKKIHLLRPEIPIIVCTGYSEKINAEKARRLGIRGFLLKPILMDDLALCIKKTLEPQKEEAGESV